MRMVLIPALLLGLLLSAPARAQQAAPPPEALAIAREMLSVISPDMMQQMNSMIMAQAMRPLERVPNMTPEKLGEIRTEVEKITIRFISIAMADAPAVYAKHLTESEMREIMAFYRTPTGAKTLKVFPQMTAEVMGLIMPRMGEMQRELGTAIQAIMQKP